MDKHRTALSLASSEANQSFLGLFLDSAVYKTEEFLDSTISCAMKHWGFF